MISNKKFVYTIVKNDSLSVKAYYHGKISNSSFTDTIVLDYKSNFRPTGAKSYLIREISVRYLIQQFKNIQKPVFMRIQRLRHKF